MSWRNGLFDGGTSAAANYRAACRSRSDAEFIARIGVALEEADESALWLEAIADIGISRTNEAFRLLDEAQAVDRQSRAIAHHGCGQLQPADKRAA